MSTAPMPSRFATRLVWIIITVIGVVGLLYLSVRFEWEEQARSYLSERTLAPKAQLTVTLNHGQAKVMIDGQEIGKTPLDLTNLNPGKNTLQLVRDPNPNNYYSQLNIPITLVARSQTVVVADLGPSYETSSFLVSYIDSRQGDTSLFVESLPTGTQIALNNEFRGQSPLAIDDLSAADYQLNMSQVGYQPLSTTVTVSANKTIFVSAKLYKIPLALP